MAPKTKEALFRPLKYMKAFEAPKTGEDPLHKSNAL